MGEAKEEVIVGLDEMKEVSIPDQIEQFIKDIKQHKYRYIEEEEGELESFVRFLLIDTIKVVRDFIGTTKCGDGLIDELLTIRNLLAKRNILPIECDILLDEWEKIEDQILSGYYIHDLVDASYRNTRMSSKDQGLIMLKMIISEYGIGIAMKAQS